LSVRNSGWICYQKFFQIWKVHSRCVVSSKTFFCAKAIAGSESVNRTFGLPNLYRNLLKAQVKLSSTLAETKDAASILVRPVLSIDTKQPSFIP
jgi:hypothetical protein